MNTNLAAASPSTVDSLLGVLDSHRVSVVQKVGLAVLRYGLVFLLLSGGAVKFTAWEAKGISGFIEHSPFMSWMYSILSVQATSNLIGIVEISLGLGIFVRRWIPAVSGIASLAAAGVFLLTLSFFFTTPGASAPGSEVGGFLIKDLILMGAALSVGAEALIAAHARAGSR